MKSLFKIFALLAGFSGAALLAQSANDVGIRVELHIYSGIPNPSFLLKDTAEIRELLSNLVTLPAETGGSRKVRSVSKFGFRGLSLSNTSGVHPEVATAKIDGGVIELQAKGFTADSSVAAQGRPTTARLSDSNRAVERRLLRLALREGAIDDALFALLGGE